MRKLPPTKKYGEIRTLPHVGLQLLDVLTVTDSRAAISSEPYRAWGIQETYDATKHALIYWQKVTLRGR